MVPVGSIAWCFVGANGRRKPKQEVALLSREFPLAPHEPFVLETPLLERRSAQATGLLWNPLSGASDSVSNLKNNSQNAVRTQGECR